MESEVSEVLPGLYVGGLSSLKYLDALGISHVLSVVNFPLQKDLSAFTSLQLPLQDSEGANMLQYLPAAIKFLDAALGPAPGPEAAGAASGGGTGTGGGGPAGTRVLVHCQAGVSRSPAVVAGWLMRSRGLGVEESLELLRARRPGAEPNEGFRAQLVLFGDMRCSLDPEHPVYRMWCLEELSSRWEEQGYIDPDAFAQLPEGPVGLSAAVAAQQTLYRCRKCRQLLATSAHVMPVEAAMGHRIFRDRQNRRPPPGIAAAGVDSTNESCLFVEPLSWMAGTVTGVVGGKLHCPKCAARLGSFNWSGISNPSGAWVTPAFQLHHSKIDTVLPKPLEALANVRRPLVGPARTPVLPPGRSPVTAADAAPGGTGGDPAAAGGPTAAAAGQGGAGLAVSAAAAAAAAATTMAAMAAPSLPASLSAAVRKMGLGRAGGGADEEEEEQLPEPALDLGTDPDPSPAPAPAQAAHSPHLADGALGDAAAVAPGDPGQSAVATTAAAAVVVTDYGGAGGGVHGGPAGCTSAWFTHLILDCDGVMVDSEAASCEALRRAILEVTGFDIPHAFPGDYVPVFGMDVRSCVAYYREHFNRTDWDSPEALAPRVQAAKEGHYRELTAGGIRAFDGAEQLIRRALAAGMQVGVASSAAPEKIAHNLSSSGLAPLVEPHAIVSASQCAAGKPAPDVYLAAMKATGCIDPWRALVVEDAVNGLKAARAAGMYCVGITNQLPANLLADWAHRVVDHLRELDPTTMRPDGEERSEAGR
ncbi:hypothetical protein GPECTOR_32g499 [Gonium pectorale]|uniref:protein-tyrosine-phosphatase n=1 Tax=Gonium pectorale TaxID=33097 RepID=A0A150GDH5_GONPE|nr:hypothetical protein GPECTOR_32g499 [Gonium pectorale]|eukprot:KXZ47886.1 hypothetical protein GPECTOR_32g499 [Gonium pectorale]